MKDKLNVAVVGATGMVGEAMLDILAERKFPIANLHALASERSVGKSVQFGVFRFSPTLGVNWLNSKLADHDFGVPRGAATPERPAYSVDDAMSVEGGMMTFVELSESWLAIISVSVEFLDSEVTDSPIVSEDYVVQGFGAINYAF